MVGYAGYWLAMGRPVTEWAIEAVEDKSVVTLLVCIYCSSYRI